MPGHAATSRDGGLRARWERLFLFLTASLASTVVLKVGQIQYLEILYVIEIVVLLAAFSKNDWQVSLFKPIATLGLMYGAFLSGAVVLAVWALQRDVYIAAGLTILRYPIIITVVRSAELLASLLIMLYLGQVFRRSEEKVRTGMRIYFRVGVLSAAYALLTYPLSRANILYLGTSADYRLRGFYNEGGPYGLYVLSVLLVGINLYQLRWERRRWLMGGFLLLFMGFIGSQSKSAMAALLFIGLLDLLLLRSVTQRILVATSLGITLLIAIQFVDIAGALKVYRQASVAYERASHQYKNNGNYVIGRVAGAFIVPKMIAEHPWTGVGWGNYALTRNAPEYRGASAWVDVGDDPAMGLAGLAAELGLPLTGMLLVCLLLPAIYLRRRGVSLPMMNLALLQPVVHLFGAQLNLTYPWIVTAFALGLGFRSRAATATATATAAVASGTHGLAWVEGT